MPYSIAHVTSEKCNCGWWWPCGYGQALACPHAQGVEAEWNADAAKDKQVCVKNCKLKTQIGDLGLTLQTVSNIAQMITDALWMLSQLNSLSCWRPFHGGLLVLFTWILLYGMVYLNGHPIMSRWVLLYPTKVGRCALAAKVAIPLDKVCLCAVGSWTILFGAFWTDLQKGTTIAVMFYWLSRIWQT